LTTHAGDVVVARALKAGARAYLPEGAATKGNGQEPIQNASKQLIIKEILVEAAGVELFSVVDST
jgi:hypothetical protein